MNRIIPYLVFATIFLSSLESKAQHWQLNFDQAQMTSKEQDRPLLIVFQGSDWCAPCIKLEREIWNSSDFIDYANKELVLLQVDFPRRRKNKHSEAQAIHNAALAEKYNPQGIFPLVVLLDPQGNILAETGHKNITASEYIDHLNQLLSSH